MKKRIAKNNHSSNRLGAFQDIGMLLWLPILLLETVFYNKVYRPAKHAFFLRFGTRTTGSVIQSSHCEGDDGVGLRGVFRFFDFDGHPHDHRFELCNIHRPSEETWARVQQTYSEGSVSEVFYLRRWPSLYEIQFAIYPMSASATK